MSKTSDPSAQEAAEAIATEASRLQRLALKHDFQFLGYLLEMVVLEAWREASGDAAAPGKAAAGLEMLRLKGQSALGSD
jgi:hypothetical protein